MSLAQIGVVPTTFSSIGAYDAVVADTPDMYEGRLSGARDWDFYEKRIHERNEKSKKNITVSVETVIMSALIFIAVLIWFDFLRNLYNATYLSEDETKYKVVWASFFYALFITALNIVLIYMVYKLSEIFN